MSLNTKMAEWLEGQGYSGSLNTMWMEYLADQGFSGPYNTRYRQWLEDKTGETGSLTTLERKYYTSLSDYNSLASAKYDVFANDLISSAVTLTNDQSTLQTTTIKMNGTNGTSSEIDWGDGNTTTASHDGTEKTYTHDYSSTGTYTLKITEDLDAITEFGATTQGYISGDIGTFSVLTSLTDFNISNTSVSGDISGISTLTSLTDLRLYSTSVSGDISGISTLTSLTLVNINTTSVSGDIAGINTLTSLPALNISNTSVSGDIADINTLTSLTYLHLGDTSVSDYTSTTLPAWSSCNIQLQNLSLTATEVDNFLIDLNDAGGSNGTVDLSGNAARTSASDTAVSSLTSRGWTVTTA
jgi:hypothetical protein